MRSIKRRTAPNYSIAALLTCVVACGGPPGQAPDPASSPTSVKVDPARIDRVRIALPPGYEVAGLDRVSGPATLWGYGVDWSAEPAQCGALAMPTTGAKTTRGWSASGPGGIVYAAVATAPAPLNPPVVVDECRHWSVSGGRTTGSVSLEPAPAIEDASTVAMATASTTVVEGGTETRSHAETVTAYLREHVAFVTVLTDPGSPQPQLGADFVADLMVKTVSALRG